MRTCIGVLPYPAPYANHPNCADPDLNPILNPIFKPSLNLQTAKCPHFQKHTQRQALPTTHHPPPPNFLLQGAGPPKCSFPHKYYFNFHVFALSPIPMSPNSHRHWSAAKCVYSNPCRIMLKASYTKICGVITRTWTQQLKHVGTFF